MQPMMFLILAISAHHTILTKEEQVKEEISMKDVLMSNHHLHLPGFELIEGEQHLILVLQ